MTLSVLVLLIGIGAFYWYDDFPLVLRIAMVVGGLAVAAGLVWFSWYGREFWQFAQASRIELRKVVWPSRDETIKTTIGGTSTDCDVHGSSSAQYEGP